MKKWKKMMGVGLIVGATVCLSGCGKATIDLNEYFDYSVTGYNANGSIDEDISKSDIMYDNPKAFGVDDATTDKSLLGDFQAYLYIDELGGEWDKDEDLSNGDKVTFKWDESAIQSIEEAFDVKLKHKDIEVTVEGLEEVSKYDAFEGLKVSYDSLAPYGTVSLDSSSCGIPDLIYSAEPSTGLNNGDEITVTVDVPDDCAGRYGKVPEKKSKTYKVEGLAGFVTSAADIPEDTMNAMKKQAEDVKKANAAGWDSDTGKMNSMTYVGNYFLTLKDDIAKDENLSINDSFHDAYNKLYLIYRLNVTNNVGTYDFYWYCMFDRITVLADGTYSVDTSNYYTPNRFDDRAYFGSDLYYTGFKDESSLFSRCVTQNAAEYNYEKNFVSEQNTDVNAEADTDAGKEADTEQS